MNFMVLAAGIVAIMIIWRNIIAPNFYVKRIEKDKVNLKQYCLIDIRDYTTFHRNPTTEAKNIPLSYLQREVREDTICDKQVIVFADGKRDALLAARILNKRIKQTIYYVTI